MSRKHASLCISKEIEKNPKIEEEKEDLQKLEAKTYLRAMTQKEKIQAANKPLYLRRYE